MGNRKRKNLYQRFECPNKLLKIIAVLASFIWMSQVDAKLYKCTSEKGEISYSQLPCPENQNAQMIKETIQPKSSDAVCHKVQRFAELLAEEMRSGTEAQTHIDRYGGLSAAHKSTIAIVNDIHRYKVNKDILPSRIAALIFNKCGNDAYGEISEGDIPLEDEKNQQTQQISPSPEEWEAKTNLPTSSTQSSHDFQKPQQLVVDSAQKEKCDKFKQEVNRIDERMRRGYTNKEGDKLKQKRKDYRKRIQQEC